MTAMKPSELLDSEETLFRNEEVFSPDHIPDQFLFREGQLKEMMFCLKPALRNARPTSAFVIGKPATGKTTSMRLIFDQLKSSTGNVIPVYINCHIHSSPFKIISEIRRAVLGMPAPDTGVPITRVQDEVFSRLARDKKMLVVALDEANYLMATGIADEVMYNILRAHESYPGVRTCVFGISTEEMVHQLDDKVRSIYSPVRIEFRPYSSDEVFGILEGRREAGIYPDVVPDALLRKMASRSKDLRFAIGLLKQTIMEAEKDASKKATAKHLESAIKAMEPPETSSDKMVILRTVREKGPIESGKLFTLVTDQVQMSYTTFYRMVRRLEAARLIDIEQSASKSKSRGRTSVIRAK